MFPRKSVTILCYCSGGRVHVLREVMVNKAKALGHNLLSYLLYSFG